MTASALLALLALLGWCVLLLATLWLLRAAWGVLVFSKGFTGRVHPMAWVLAAAGLLLAGLVVYSCPLRVSAPGLQVAG